MPFDRARLARLRAQHVLTQKELGARAGLTELTISKIETGQQTPRPSTIRKLASALDVKPTDLIDDAD